MKRQSYDRQQIEGATRDSSSLSDAAEGGRGDIGSDPTSSRHRGRADHVAVAVAQHENESDSTSESEVRPPKKRRRKSRGEQTEERKSAIRGQHVSVASHHQAVDPSISRVIHPSDLAGGDARRDNVMLQQLYQQLQEQELSALSRIALHQQASLSVGMPYSGLHQPTVASMLESSNSLYQRLHPLGYPPQPASLLELLGRNTAPQWPSSLHDTATGLSAMRAASRGLSPLETIALASQSEQLNPYSSIYPNMQPQSLENLIIQEQQRQQMINRAMSSDPIMGRAGMPPVPAPPQRQPSPAVLAPAGDDLFIPALRRQFPGGFVSDQRTVILAIPDDRAKLNSQQVFLRHQIEVFRASHDDILSHTRGRNKPVMLGQVGIRCRHCGNLPVAKRAKGSTYFPSSVTGIYQASQNLSVTHLQSGLCSEMPFEMKQQFTGLVSSKVASSGVGRPYWAEAARKLGLVDTPYGIRFREDLPPGGLEEADDGADDPPRGTG